MNMLTKRADFVALNRHATSVAANGLILQAMKRDAASIVPANDNVGKAEAASWRVGFTVSKKVGNAVVRNRVKRRLRVLVREVLAKAAMPNVDYVVIGRKSAAKKPYEALVKDMEYTVRTLKRSFPGLDAPSQRAASPLKPE